MGYKWTQADIQDYQKRMKAQTVARELAPDAGQIGRMRMHRYLIGIDCGVKTGIAAYDRATRKLLSVESMTITKALTTIYTLRQGVEFFDIFVRIEDARLRKFIPREKDEKAERGRREGAGSVKRDASIWEGFLQENFIPYEMVAPKDNTTKVDADAFKMMTGWTYVTNEHGRDAAMLVYGF